MDELGDESLADGPLSPVIRNLRVAHATRSASAQIAWIAALRPMMTGATDPSAGSGDALGSLPLTMESQGPRRLSAVGRHPAGKRYIGRPAGMPWLRAATADSVSKYTCAGIVKPQAPFSQNDNRLEARGGARVSTVGDVQRCLPNRVDRDGFTAEYPSHSTGIYGG